MKEIKTTADLPNATAIDLGPLAELSDYVLELGPGVKIPGKVFGGAAVKAGGADFSLQVFAPGRRAASTTSTRTTRSCTSSSPAPANTRWTATTSP